MAWNTLKFRLVGEATLLMKNGETADPLNPFAKAAKEITSKGKNKTDADYLELNRIDFMGALYMNDNGPCIPATVIEGTLIAGAKKNRKGPQAKAGVYCEGTFDLEYEGPRDPDELYANSAFKDVRPVKVNNAKVMRCRPKFKIWSVDIKVNYDDAMCNSDDVEKWLKDAGVQCGLGDYRPKYGRFTVEPLAA